MAIAEQLAVYLDARRGARTPSTSLGLPAEVLEQLGPYLPLAEKLGSLAGQLAPAGAARGDGRGRRRAGRARRTRPLASRALVGLLPPLPRRRR